MDLAAAARQIQLDILARDVSAVLTKAGIPHVLLKGPSTARWLYDPPRFYRDVDMLVPRSRVKDAKRAIEKSGLAFASAGALGEEASHSWLMVTPAGFELDLHIVLPMMNPYRQRKDAVWEVLSPHIESMDIEGSAVPVLDVPGRCVMLALHAIGGRAVGMPKTRQRFDDLLRAREQVDAWSWREAEMLADRLGARNLFDVGLSLVDPSVAAPVPPTVVMRNEVGASSAFALDRIKSAPLVARPGLFLRELIPTRGFMRYAFPVETRTRRGLAHAYARRLRRLAAQAPRALALRRRITKREHQRHERQSSR